MTLIDSGFTPQALPVLREKIKQIVLTKIKYRANNFKYDIAQSASAFVVPGNFFFSFLLRLSEFKCQ
jgi:hypothetical protein